MFVSTALRQRFEASLPHIEAIAYDARATILTYCEQKGHAFQSRIKTLESLPKRLNVGDIRLGGIWMICLHVP